MPWRSEQMTTTLQSLQTHRNPTYGGIVDKLTEKAKKLGENVMEKANEYMGDLTFGTINDTQKQNIELLKYSFMRNDDKLTNFESKKIMCKSNIVKEIKKELQRKSYKNMKSILQNLEVSTETVQKKNILREFIQKYLSTLDLKVNIVQKNLLEEYEKTNCSKNALNSVKKAVSPVLKKVSKTVEKTTKNTNKVARGIAMYYALDKDDRKSLKDTGKSLLKMDRM